MCAITAEMPDTMDGILYQARNFRLSSGTGAAYLVQLLNLKAEKYTLTHFPAFKG